MSLLVEQGAASRSRHRGGLTGGARLVLHAAALLLVLVGAAALTRAGTGVSSDEGAGVYQAVLLGRGRWILPPTLPELDPLRARQPFFRSEIGARGWAPYGKHPLYPALLSVARRVRPVGGLVAVSVIGAWLAAAFAALLAERIRPGRGPAALWLVGGLSPLTVDSTWVLAHAPAAAAGAAMLYAAAQALRRGVPTRSIQSSGGPVRSGGAPRGVWWLATSAVAAGLTVALRTEGLILVAAVAFGLLVCRRPDRRSLLAAASVAAGGVGARLVEVVVVRRVVGAAAAVPATPTAKAGFLADRASAFRASWMEPGSWNGRLLVVAGTLLIVAAVAFRRRFPAALVGGFGALAVTGTVVWVVNGPDLVPGLVPATAWLAVGAIVFGRRSLSPGLPRLLSVSSVVAAIGILAIQYSFGGGVEWGGRFYAILLPGAGALVAGAWPEGRPTGSRPLVAALAVVAALTSFGGLLAVRQEHQRTDRLEADLVSAAAVAAPGRPADDDVRPVVVSYHPLWPQLAWPSFDGLRWVTADGLHASCALVDLRRAGFQRIVVADRPLSVILEDAAGAGWAEDGAGPRTRYARVLMASGDPRATGGCPTS